MMLKLSVVAALVAPLVSALTVNQPSQAVDNGGDMTFTWTTAANDPATFSVFLENPTFNNVFGVANNVDASLKTLTIQVPDVPANQQYTIILVPIDNVTQVLAQSPPFNIGAATATPSSASAPVASTRTGTSPRVSGTATAPPAITPLSTSAFGNTISNTVANTNTNAVTGASTSAPAATSSHSGALPVRFDMNLGVIASMVLSVFAGAAVVAL